MYILPKIANEFTKNAISAHDKSLILILTITEIIEF